MWPPDPGRQTEWHSARLREVFKRETEAGLQGQRLTVQAYRDIAIAISRRYLRGTSQFRQNVDDEREAGVPDVDDQAAIDEDEAKGFIADLQAAHSSHVAGMLYGRQLMEPRNSTTRHR